MLFTPIYIAMTFIKTWRIRSFRARLLEFLSGNTSVAFCKVPENAAETPTLSSKLCTNPKNAYLCDLLDYTNASRICSMKPMQCIEISDWVSCAGGLPLGSSDTSPVTDLDVDVLFECELNPHEFSSHNDIITLESMGQPVAWKAGSHLAIVLKTNIEHLSVIGFQFVGGEFIIDRKLPVVRIQTVQLSGEPNKATDPSMRGLRSDIQHGLKQTSDNFQWPVHAALLRKLSKVVDIKSDVRSITREMNGGSDQALDTISVGRRQVTLADVSTITTKSLSADEETESEEPTQKTIVEPQKTPEKSLEKSPKKSPYKSPEKKALEHLGDKEMVVENVTVEIQHNITPKKSSLKLDLKKGTNQISTSLLNISSQIKSITTHKRIVSTTGPKKSQSQLGASSHVKEESSKIKEETSQPKEESSQIKEESSQPKEESSQPKEEISQPKVESSPPKEKSSLLKDENLQPKEESLQPKKKLSQTKEEISQPNEKYLGKKDDCSKIKEECLPGKEECSKSAPLSQAPLKSLKSSRPLVNTKSPNILIYSDSVVARDNFEATLRKVLDCDRYVVTSVSLEALRGGAWRGRCALVGVAGCAAAAAGPLLAHLLAGGRLLALCSDLLHAVLPHYETAEIRENEIVQFSYDKWKSVKMKHHIFCYQASPAKKQFSTESDRQPSRYSGHPGHELDIRVLASEETWRTPSLLQATDLTNKGVAIFSQIHLEADPCDYLGEEGVKSNEARLEILHKLLGEVLGLHVRDPRQLQPSVQYTRGYFLGDHVQKLSLVERWCGAGEGGGKGRVSSLGALRVQWCARGEPPLALPSENFLPVNLYECPENFNTVDYFDNLSSRCVGRVVVYADVLSSTARVAGGGRLAHGVAAVCRRQTAGRGRAGNRWISPPGQAIISLQIWQKASSALPLAQHAAALAAVRAVRSEPAYEHLDIRIKWPNDVYYGREVKIGGTITTANCMGDDVIIDIGTGVNISNSVPTTCVNDIISEHNKQHGTDLAPFTIERYLARYCSQLERILDYMDTEGGVDAFLEQYYQYWLHDNEEVRVLSEGATSPVEGNVVGLDGAGWLLVRTAGAEARVLRVQPDGNTFDMMAGLVAPKY